MVRSTTTMLLIWDAKVYLGCFVRLHVCVCACACVFNLFSLHLSLYSLQKFKLNMASTVITQENASLQSMQTSDLLDLFQLGEGESKTGSKKDSNKPAGLKDVLENLPELWNEEQYQNEYGIENFMESLCAAK